MGELREHRDELITIQESFLKTCNGRPGLNRGQLRSVLLEHGLLSHSQAQFEEIIDDAFAANHSLLSFEELLQTVTKAREHLKASSHEEIRDMFRHFDKDGS